MHGAGPMANDRDGYERCVFLNCPFDEEYEPLFEAMLFAVLSCGLTPRCAREEIDSGRSRLDWILTLIEQCRYGIHDLSRADSNAPGPPRFNMPFELGLFLGAKRYGRPPQRKKVTLILDRDPYRYQRFLSDIAGQDPEAHGGDPRELIRVLRDWLETTEATGTLPGGTFVWDQYVRYREARPELFTALRLTERDAGYSGTLRAIRAWLELDESGDDAPASPAESKR